MSSEWDESVYALAELLKMPVYKIKAEMPLSELIEWCRYFERKNRAAAPPPPLELAAMSAADLKKAFG
jgi:hypothetical protein